MGIRRAQAAMEFLMTYGWALLVVLTAISALAFFGVLNPSKFLPETCLLGPGFACEDFRVEAPSSVFPHGRILLNVRNGLGEDIDFFTIHINKDPPNTGNQMCGGFIGGVTYLPTFPGGYPIFRDGEMRKIMHGVPSPGNPPIEGINCDKDEEIFPGVPAYCCTVFNFLYTGPAQMEEVCNSGASGGLPVRCDNSPAVPLTGSKFSESLVINYRVIGSKIAHKRVGTLTAQVEQ